MWRLISDEGIVSDYGFYSSDKVMAVWAVYLVLNCIAQIVLTVSLVYLTYTLYTAVNQYFKQSRSCQQKMLILVAIAILICSCLSLVEDFYLTIERHEEETKSKGQSDSTVANGLSISCLLACIAPILLNTMYLANYRLNSYSNAQTSHQKKHSVECDLLDEAVMATGSS